MRPDREEDAIYRLLEKIEQPDVLRKGAHESLVSIEKGIAHLVIVAWDASENLKQFVLNRARLRGVPLLTVSERERLGRSCGLRVGATAVAVLDPELAWDLMRRGEPVSGGFLQAPPA